MVMISAGNGWNPTFRGTWVPTEIEKLTLVAGRTFCDLITLVILVRCSVESFAPAPAWPVVVVDDLAAPLRSSARFMLPLRSSAFMSFDAPGLLFSELMLLERSPFILLSWADFSPFVPALSTCARWFLPPSRSMSLDDFGASADAPLCEASRFVGAAEGACCVAAPDDGASRLCALAKPVPAISAAAATDIKKRLLMGYLLVTALPAPTTKG